MPAILDSASQDDLTTPHQPDDNHPASLHITFKTGYIPTGSFCNIITRLVSLGPHSILGLKWSLVEEGVKRNRFSFFIDGIHKVTLLCHEQSYEIRVTREDPDVSLHDICSHVLSVFLYILKSLFQHLEPHIAFQCPCSQHQPSINNLCSLSCGAKLRLICEETKKVVTLRPEQQVWIGKVSIISCSLFYLSTNFPR